MQSAEPDISARLTTAIELSARAADLIQRHYGRPDLAVDRKRDRSPVTAADRGAEELLRREILERFPDDGVLGEEFGEHPATNEYRWILDPVDGTKAFVHGVPLYGTLIGLERAGQLVAGLCRLPALGELVYASIGNGAWWQVLGGETRPARVSETSAWSEAVVCFTEMEGYDRVGRLDVLDRFREKKAMIRGWGDCYGHILVATGRADVMIDPLMNPWDIAALIPILQEAGGSCVGWNGMASVNAGNAVSVNAALREEALAVVRG